MKTRTNGPRKNGPRTKSRTNGPRARTTWTRTNNLVEYNRRVEGEDDDNLVEGEGVLAEDDVDDDNPAANEGKEVVTRMISVVHLPTCDWDQASLHVPWQQQGAGQ